MKKMLSRLRDERFVPTKFAPTAERVDTSLSASTAASSSDIRAAPAVKSWHALRLVSLLLCPLPSLRCAHLAHYACRWMMKTGKQAFVDRHLLPDVHGFLSLKR